ncbi:MAG: glycosyltransferase [Bdellovibrionales bacterium]|nr:glycosyltransferase [Bdellovibrionales bacterium]
MKILLFHPAPLPPKDYGGVERVVLWLAEGLRDFGHEVTVAALEGSRLPRGVELLGIPANERSAAALPKRLPRGIDVVHFQAPPEREYFETDAAPAVTTIHGNGKPGEVFPEHTVFLSRDHAERHGRKTFVYNGVNPGEFALAADLGSKKRQSAPLFLSKTTLKTKNLRGAMTIAEHAGLRLAVAGGNRPLGLRLRSLLSGGKWIGPVAGREKSLALAEASALLFPVLWHEPFGLVMIEALLSGTPVVGSRKGSIPEIVGATSGMVLDLPRDEDDENALDRWAEALRTVEKLDPVLLRKDAQQRFSHHRMAESYLEVYKRVIRGDPL